MEILTHFIYLSLVIMVCKFWYLDILVPLCQAIENYKDSIIRHKSVNDEYEILRKEIMGGLWTEGDLIATSNELLQFIAFDYEKNIVICSTGNYELQYIHNNKSLTERRQFQKAQTERQEGIDKWNQLKQSF